MQNTLASFFFAAFGTSMIWMLRLSNTVPVIALSVLFIVLFALMFGLMRMADQKDASGF